jgi:hypothetical protein
MLLQISNILKPSCPSTQSSVPDRIEDRAGVLSKSHGFIHEDYLFINCNMNKHIIEISPWHIQQENIIKVQRDLLSRENQSRTSP